MRSGLLMMVLGLACAGAMREGQATSPHGEVIFPDGTLVGVEIADTEPKRQRGLMFRQTLAPNEGMIFIFDTPGAHPFWMQNCLIALDMIWLDGDGRVLHIARSVPPCRLPGCPPPCNSPECPSYGPEPDTMASYVVEVVSGFTKERGLTTGDVLELRGIAQAR